MRRSIMTIAALALLTTSAHASKVWTLHKGKYWETFGIARNDQGDPMCGMKTTGDNNRFYIKWSPDAGMTVQIWKSTWQIAEGTKVAFALAFFDNAKPDDVHTLTTETGTASPIRGVAGTSVYMSVKSEDAPDVIGQFAAADKIVISFPNGDEPAWGVRMEGSRRAASEFVHCMELITGSKPTSPIKPTSPVAPTQPIPAKPVQKNDGSV